MPSKFGGEPVEDASVKSKFGGVSADGPTAAATPAPPHVDTDEERVNKSKPLFSVMGIPFGTSDPGAGYFGQGARQIGHGVTAMSQPGVDPKLGAAAEIAGGVGKILTPVGIGAALPALVTAPGATATALVGGGVGSALGSHGARALAKMAGAGPGGQNAAETAGGLVGGAAGVPGAFAARTVAPVVGEGMLRGVGASATRAGQNFERVGAATQNHPVDVTSAYAPLAEAQSLGRTGGYVPKVMNDFAQMYGDKPVPGQPTLTDFPTARNFAKNAGKLSVDEKLKTNPEMGRNVTAFSRSLADANQKAAHSAGAGNEYDAAMKEYARAMALRNAGQTAKDLAAKYGLKTILGGGAAYTVGRKLIDR